MSISGESSVGDGPLAGFVDSPVHGASVSRRNVVVRGWHTWNGIGIAAVAVEAAGLTVVVTPGSEARADVADAFGNPALSNSGWRAVLDLSDPPDGKDDRTEILVTVWGSPDSAPVALTPIDVTLLDEPDPPPPPKPAVVGHLDRPSEGEMVDPLVQFSGWAIGDESPVSRVEILVDGRSFDRARLGMPRMDLGLLFAQPHAVVSGFEQLIDLSDRRRGPAHLVVRAWSGGADPVDVVDHWFELAPTGKPAAPDRNGNEDWDQRKAILAARRERLVQRVGGTSSSGLNLAVVTHDLQRGGAQLWLMEFLRRSGAGRDFACRVYSFGAGPLLADLEAAGIEVHVTQGQPPPDVHSYEGRVTEVGMLLAAGGHNAVFVNTVLPWLGADAAARLGLPVVWTIHESYPPDELWDSSLFPPVEPEVRATLKHALRNVQALVFVAEATRQLYIGTVEADRTIVVPSGIDLDEIEVFRQKVTAEAARAAVGIDPGTMLILAVGVVQPRKAQTLLAEAFAEVAQEFPNALLVIVGDAGDVYGVALVEYLRRSGLSERIQIVPVTANTSVWYRAADAFVCASDVESLPRTVLEALAFGLPVTSTSVFGIPELLTDGETAYLFQARDKDAAVDALRRLLGSSPSELIQLAAAGHQLALDSLDSSAYSGDLIALLDGLRADPMAQPADVLGSVRVRLAW